MQMQGLKSQEIWRSGTPDVAANLKERYARLQALDNGPTDADPRECYVSVPREDGTLQAILGRSFDGPEYTARVVGADGALVRGENGSFADDGSQVLASHFEAGGQRAQFCGPTHFQDITTETEAKAFFVRAGGEETHSLESGTLKQWQSPGNNVCVLAEFGPDGAAAEEYFYSRQFDLSWNP